MFANFSVQEAHIPIWEGDWRYCFLMGGRGNGRSGTAARYVVSQLLGKEYTRGAIMRATREDIRTSSWRDINDLIEEQKIVGRFRVVNNDMHLEHGQNSINAHGFRASSGSLTARLKSLAGYNLVWIEEAEEIGENEFTVLDDSLRTIKGRIKIIFSLNTPSKSHWIIKRWFDLVESEYKGFFIPQLKKEIKDTLYIPGTYESNLINIDPATAERYESYKNTKPSYYYQLIRGLCPEVVLGRIYSGWQEIDSIPHEARLMGYGLDFGFDPDEAALVAVYYHNRGYLLDEKIYATRLLNENLAAHIKLLPPAPIIADSAEPKSIEEMNLYGLNIIPCVKGPDSVNFGIKLVQGLKISYTKTSVNLKKEYENYAWKINKDGEDTGIEDPKCANHLLTAARYYLADTIKANADPEAELRKSQEERLMLAKHRKEFNSTRKSRYGLAQ